MVKVVVDQDLCIECWVCYSICGEVFEEGEGGKSRIVKDYRGDQEFEGDVPESIDCVDDFIEQCPVDAIEKR